MSETWVVNASPVIVLAKTGDPHLLERLSSEVLLPLPVALEILSGPASDPARQAVESGWGNRVTLDHIPVDLLEWGLGAGETAVLAVARERASCLAVLDDGSARSCAKAFGIPAIGTLGIVLRAKRRGMIPSAVDVIRKIRIARLYLDDVTLRTALQRIGEEWN